MTLTFDENRALLVPRHDEAAERACLGGCLLNKEGDANTFDIVSEIISGPEDFYKKAHQEIYAAMVRLAETNSGIDLLTVANYLRIHQKLEFCGGGEYLELLVETVPSSANIRTYARLVADNAVARRLQSAGVAIDRLAADESIELSERLDRAEELIFGVGSSRTRGELEPISEAIGEAFKEICLRREGGAVATGVLSGFTELDELTTGFQPSNLIIVGARPSMGKTAFALSIAVNVALREERPGVVAIFSLEMSREDLCLRMISSLASVNSHSVRSGQVKKEEWNNLTQAVAELSSAPIFIDDQGGATVLEIKAKLRRMKKRYGLDLVIIDYLQLLRGSWRAENRVNEISEISRQLKTLSKELHVPIIALSQVSRNVENRQDKRPILADLRESGAIEQDADLVMFLYRDEYYNKQNAALDIPGGNADLAEVIVAKHRNGPTGTIKLRFAKKFGGFYNPGTKRHVMTAMESILPARRR